MRLRLILSFVLIVLVTVGSVVWIARQNTARELRAFMFRGGMVSTSDIATALEGYYQANHTWQGAASLLETAGHGANRGQGTGPGMGPGSGLMNMMNQRLILADASGNLVADTANPHPSGSLSSVDLQSALPLQVDGQVVGYLLSSGGVNFGPSDETVLLNRLNRVALTAGLIAGGLALLLALLLAYSLARPLRALTQAASRLAQGDLTQRVKPRGHDELSALGQAFNHMASALQQTEESRRAMTADIAHELRNPLAVQRAHLEALQDGVYPLTAENLVPILEQNLLLTRLVEDLRTLALADAGQLPLERTPTDFPALAQRTVERFRPQAEARQVDLRITLPAPSASSPLLHLDPMRVEEIIGNLLSNALRFTPPGGQIECRVSFARASAGEQVNYPSQPARPTSRCAFFTVHDSGPGIPPEALPHVFERFYRADHARSRAEGGTGLGLAIARQLAVSHGGSLTAANHPQGGALFTLALPCS
jgi:signal transduction histidine kinase